MNHCLLKPWIAGVTLMQSVATVALEDVPVAYLIVAKSHQVPVDILYAIAMAESGTPKRIRELKSSLIGLIELSSSAGKDAAMNEVPITRFFSIMGRLFGVSTEMIRNLGYGLLALLLEVITLGAISLANSMRHDVLWTDKETDDATKPEASVDDSEQRQRIVDLSNDIIRGRVQPVIRRIKAGHYKLDIDEIRQVLMNLHMAGLIEKDARNSYKLVDRSTP